MIAIKFNFVVVGGNSLTDSFKIRIRVMQGCTLSPFQYIMPMDWLMHTIISGKHCKYDGH